jgi:alcohol dehydrogenase
MMVGGAMSQPQMFYMPTRVVHGVGSAETLPAQVKAVGGNKAFVCTDKGLTAAGVTAGITASLEAGGVPFSVFDEVEEDPGVRTVSAGVEAFLREDCDLVVGLGGGSPLCAAKGIALVAANGGTLTDYEGFNKAAGPPRPVIAMPTTAGSGTEVSRVTILTDEARNFKMSIIDERTYPAVAILDGALMASLPAQPALVAGMDALAHALDALWSVGATEFSDGLATKAAATIFRDLPASALSGDIGAKQRMLEASAIANMALGIALPGLAHVLSQPLGRLHLPHGLATGIMLPYTMEFNLPVAAQKIAPVARLLGDSGTDRSLAEGLLERLWRLMDDVGFPTCLDPAVVTDDELPILVEQCTKVVNYRLNLRNAAPADLEQLYRRALARG